MPTGTLTRKQWDTTSNQTNPILATEALASDNRRPDVSPDYEEYLLLVQARNRALKKLQVKNSRELDLEKKEFGFTVYVNGANSRNQRPKTVNENVKSYRRPRTCKNKLLNGGDHFSVSSHRAVSSNTSNDESLDLRAKTAPEKSRRKRWNVASIDLKTSGGEKIRVRGPGGPLHTGRYDDDFEQSEEEEVEEEEEREGSEEERTDSDADSQSEIEEEEFVDASRNDVIILTSNHHSEKNRPSNTNKNRMEKVMLSLNDVHRLRQSLEMNSSIRDSLACSHDDDDSDSSDAGFSPSEEPIEEVDEMSHDVAVDKSLNVKSSQSLSNIGRPSVVSKSSDQSGSKQPHLTTLKPNDVIVLEFATSPSSISDNASSSTPRTHSRTPREERARNRVGQESVEDARIRKSRELLLRPEKCDPSGSSPREARRSLDVKVSVSAAGQVRSSGGNPRVSKDRNAVETSRSLTAAPQQSVAVGDAPILSVATDKASSLGAEDLSSAAANVGVCGGNMDSIVEKVLRLDVKGQRHLMKILAQIEQGAGDMVDMTSNIDANLPAQDRVEPSKSDASALPKKEPRSQLRQVSASATRQKMTTIPVTIELLSNWGHASRIGLTEIQIYDSNRKKIDLQEGDLQTNGTTSVKGDLAALVNGKAKTTKEKNMWSCEFKPQNPVSITINARTECKDGKVVSDNQIGSSVISQLKIWNYNRSVGETCIGACKIKVSIGKSGMVWEGELDKGTGNQIFEYGKTINLTKGGAQTPDAGDDKIDIVVPSLKLYAAKSEGEVRKSRKNPTANSVSASESRSINKSRAVKEEESVASFPSPLESIDTAIPAESSKKNKKKKVITSSSSSSVAANLRVSASNEFSDQSMSPSQRSEDDENVPMFLKIQKLNKERKEKTIPTWLAGASDIPESPALSEKDEDDDLLENWSKSKNLPTILDESSGEAKKKSKKAPLDELLVDSEVDGGEGGARAITPMQRIEMRRRRTLEESWSSLDLFNRLQRGRISFDGEHDTLDEYLLGERGSNTQTGEGVSGAGDPSSLGAIDEDEEAGVFTIPELPSGRQIVIDILTTWGDYHYVGLNGLEIFTEAGTPARVAKITADPSDINILPDYDGDPRVVENLIDGVNRTRDDTHMWLAPFTAGARHTVTVTLVASVRVAMMRIWNYNKSRIHSSRGARDVEIRLDGVIVFKGEIARACGGMIGGVESFGDTILFTTDEDILENVSRNDDTFEADLSDGLDDIDGDATLRRPQTADREEPRPFTSAANMFAERNSKGRTTGLPPNSLSDLAAGTDLEVGKRGKFRTGRYLSLNITATWGDAHYLGLTGLEVIDSAGQVIPLDPSLLDANPRDLRVLPGYEGDDRTLDKLVDGINVTTVDEHMWLIPFTKGERHEVRIDLGSMHQVAALRFWNYNKSPEDTYRGARIIHAELDGRRCSPTDGFLVRKGPGNCFFDFAQELPLVDGTESRKEGRVKRVGELREQSTRKSVVDEKASQEYEAVQAPFGFIYQLQLLSSWGDPYYIGLNGIEMYDVTGQLIPLTANSICAYPESINALARVADYSPNALQSASEPEDVRTPDKLVDGVNDTMDGRHMWLAPTLPGILNRVYILFDYPVEISMLKIWNYAKTPGRGVKDFALLVDDLLVYNGTLDAAPVVGGGSGGSSQRYHTVLFTTDTSIRERERHTQCRGDTGEQDVAMMNDRQVWLDEVGRGKARGGEYKPPVDQALRPGTSVPSRGRGGKMR